MADTAVLNLGLNSRSYERNLNRVDNKTKKFGRSTIKVSGLVSGIFAGSIAIASFRMIKLASDAEETASKFDTIFKGLGKQANEVADAFARDFGLAGSSSRKLLGNTSDLLTGLGFTKAGALDLSHQVNKLAVDLASFTNFSGGAEGASNALTKALLGERESIKSLGISINEKDVKEQIAINRSNGLTFATEKQARAQATLTLALKQSKNAIGDYARTSDSTANRIKLMGQSWLTAQESMGKFLIEGLEVDKVLETITKGLVFLANEAHTVKLAIQSLTAGFASGISKAWIQTKGFLSDSISGYELLWTKATGSSGEFKRLQDRIKFEKAQRKAMLDGVEQNNKKSIERISRAWNKADDKRRTKTKANADKAISDAKKIEEALGVKPAEIAKPKDTSSSNVNRDFSSAVLKGTVEALKLEKTTLGNKTEKSNLKVNKQSKDFLKIIADNSGSTEVANF